MGLSYPNKDDAKRGLNEGLISKLQYDSIVNAEKYKHWSKWPASLWYTGLGGEVGIHGLPTKNNDSFLDYDILKAGDWTWGCISLLNRDARELFRYIPIGTPVLIEK